MKITPDIHFQLMIKGDLNKISYSLRHSSRSQFLTINFKLKSMLVDSPGNLLMLHLRIRNKY